MTRGKDEKNNERRRPLVLVHPDVPKVLWVNFKSPQEPHEGVVAQLLGVKEEANP